MFDRKAAEFLTQLERQYWEKAEPLQKEHNVIWTAITEALRLDPNKKLTLDLVTGEVFEVSPLQYEENCEERKSFVVSNLLN